MSEWDAFPLVQRSPAAAGPTGTAPEQSLADVLMQSLAPTAAGPEGAMPAAPAAGAAPWDAFPLAPSDPSGGSLADMLTPEMTGDVGQQGGGWDDPFPREAQSPGFSSTDPTRTEADFWSDVQNDVVAERPWSSRLATALQGVPFAGQYVDEAIGAVSPQAATATRVSQEAMADTRPVQSAALQTAGAVAGSIPMIAAAGPSIVAGAPQALGARMAVGAGAGAIAGATEGAVSGYGRGKGDERVENAKEDAVLGAGVGGVTGLVAPVAAEGIRNLVVRLKGKDVTAIAHELGVSASAARAIKSALEGEDFAAAGQSVARGGPDASLLDAGPATQALGDTVGQAGGPASRIMREAVDERSTTAAGRVDDALDAAFPSGQPARAPADVKGAYDAAYSTPIDYSSEPGRAIEGLLGRVPKEHLAKARKLIEMDPNIPDEIREQFMISIRPDGSADVSKLPSVLELDYVTRALNDVARSGDGKGALGGYTNEGRIYGNLARSIRDEVKKAVPDYAKALDAAGTEIGIKEAADAGASLLRSNVTRRDVRTALAGAPQVEVDAMRQAVRVSIDDSISNVRRTMARPGTEVAEAIKTVKDLSTRAARDKLEMLLGRGEADALVAKLDEAATAFEIQAALHGNSKTAVRSAVKGSIDQATAPNVVQRVMAGEPIQATKRLAQIITGATPEAQEAVQAGIYGEIATALTSIRGPQAQRALVAIEKAMSGQPIKDREAQRLARMVTSALAVGGYTAGTQDLSDGN